MSLVCKGCNNKFSNQSGLTRHQKSCSKYLERQEGWRRKLGEKNRDQNRSSNSRKKRRGDQKELPEFVQGSSSDGNAVFRAESGLSSVAGEELEFENDNRMEIDVPEGQDLPLDVLMLAGDNAVMEPRASDGRPRRAIRFPYFRFKDHVPSQPTALPNLIPQPVRPPPRIIERQTDADTQIVPDPPTPIDPPPQPPTFVTEPNSLGVYREYATFPSSFPDADVTLDSLNDAAVRSAHRARESIRLDDTQPEVQFGTADNPYAPFANATTYLLMKWYLTGSLQKSNEQLEILVKEVLLHPDFDAKDLQHFSLSQQLKKMDSYQSSKRNDSVLSAVDGWCEAEVKIPLPQARKKYASEKTAYYFSEKLHYRKLTSVIESALSHPSSSKFHYTPFKEMSQHGPDGLPERMFGEAYTSNVYLEEYAKLQKERPVDCDMEWCIVFLMFWSDSTKLANFGNASLWPIYLFFGNQSKYDRAKPSAAVCEHIAYIPSLSDAFASFYLEKLKAKPTDDVKAFCKRDLFHAVWAILLDEEFQHAMRHGMVIHCSDGVTRRVFPRPMTYSADYIEKVAIVPMKQLALYPCNRCYVLKSHISQLGLFVDMHKRIARARTDTFAHRFDVEKARENIFVHGISVSNKDIATSLKFGSRVPNRNAFSKVLSPLNLDFHRMVVPDLMHEFELGVWKSIFTHLMRLLRAVAGEATIKLNTRYRLIPTFGRGTIRQISNDASEMKKLAARDFEDLLQCAIPVFELLFDEPYNNVVLDLLFTLSVWHAYAKLRLHTDTTVLEFEKVTRALGREIRRFKTAVCDHFVTKELPKESAAKARRRAKAASSSDGANRGSRSESSVKVFNMETIKLHFLGDYCEHIKQYGSSDSYSTQTGELEHRRVKKFYARTNKVQATRQIAVHERRQRMIRKITMEDEHGTLPVTSPEIHYSVSTGSRSSLNILWWLKENKGDPALKDFVIRLKDHILSRLGNKDYNGIDNTFTAKERNELSILQNCIYAHQTMRTNYSTYDIRRDQDTLNTRTRADIMLLSAASETSERHPYQYARVIKIFHVVVEHAPGDTEDVVQQRMDILWVRRYRLSSQQHRVGWEAKRLYRLEFHSLEDPDGYGFVDPDQVIRAAYMIPAYAYGKIAEDKSVANVDYLEKGANWTAFYVIPFVDRDMFMRYVGGGVGHNMYNSISNERLSEEPPGLDVQPNLNNDEALNDLAFAAEELHADTNGDAEAEVDADEDVSGISDSDKGDIESEDDDDSGDEEFYIY